MLILLASENFRQRNIVSRIYQPLLTFRESKLAFFSFPKRKFLSFLKQNVLTSSCMWEGSMRTFQFKDF